MLASRLPGNWLRVAAARMAGATIGAGSRLDPGALLFRGTRLGKRCRIGRDTTLDGVGLADGCTVGAEAKLSRLSAGEGTHLETRTLCIGARPGRISIGRHCYVGVSALLDYSSDITIGDFVHIAGPAAALHTHSSVPMALGGSRLDEDRRLYGEIKIGSHTWIGGHVTIYPGRSIGDHCVVLPNSVVSNDVESYTMVGGVPAQVVRLVEREDQSGSAGREPLPPERTRT